MYQDFDDADVAEDYRQLLRRGSVMRRLALARHPAWRQAIRSSAGADAHRVRTWSRGGQPDEVWAVLQDWSLTRDEQEIMQRRLGWLRED